MRILLQSCQVNGLLLILRRRKYWTCHLLILIQKTSEVLSLLRPIVHDTSKTAKVTWFILVLHWAVDVIEVLFCFVFCYSMLLLLYHRHYFNLLCTIALQHMDMHSLVHIAAEVDRFESLDNCSAFMLLYPSNHLYLITVNENWMSNFQMSNCELSNVK